MRRLAYIAVDPENYLRLIFFTSGENGLTVGLNPKHRVLDIDYYRHLDLKKVESQIEIKDGERVFRADDGEFFISDSSQNPQRRPIPAEALTDMRDLSLFSLALIGDGDQTDIEDIYERVKDIPKRIIYAQGRLDANIFEYPEAVVRAIEALRAELEKYCKAFGVVYYHENFEAVADQVLINVNERIMRQM